MATLTPVQRLMISAKARQDWYHAMARAVGDGKSVYVVLEKLSAEYARSRNPLAPLVRELLRRMSGAAVPGAAAGGRATVGTDLTGLVPTNEASLIDAGESSGSLATGFRRAGDYVQATRRLREEIVGPMQEPVGLLLMLLAILVFFSIEILPTFTAIAPRARWPRAAQVYGELADQAIPLALAVVAAMGVGLIAFFRAAANWTGPRRALCDRYLFPFTLLTRVNGAAVLTSLSGFVAAGVKFDVALNQLQQGSNRYMKTIYGQLKTGLRNATTPEDALCGLHIIDRGQHWLIRLYGDSSDFPGAMGRIADEVIAHAIARTRATFAVINMLLKILVAAFIVWTMGSLLGIVQAVRVSATNAQAHSALATKFLG
jgi:type II secretory pathway component PulF